MTQIWMYFVFLLCALLLVYLKQWLKTVKLAFSLPGPPALPLIGNALLVADSKKLEKLGSVAYEKYGPLFRSWISIIPFFHIYEPKHLQIILGSNKHINKNWFYTLMHNFIGKGLITNNGIKWKSHRRLIQPYFHKNVLEIFLPVFSSSADNLVDKLQNKDQINITTYINECVLDILLQAVLGLLPDEIERERKSSPFRKGEVFIPYRIMHPWLLLNSLFNFTSVAKNELAQKVNLHNYTKQMLLKKHQDLETTTNQSSDSSLIEMLIQISNNNQKFTDEDIINEVCTFMLAGQDSVGAAVAFSLYYLADNQDVQKKVMEELKTIDSSINANNLQQMKYLEQCIKEAMRLCPSVPIFVRRLTEDVNLGDCILPRGSNVFISPFITHRLAHLYPDPLKYNPERFSPENIQKMNPYSYIPFSAGPRNCIGYQFALLEMKTIISKILRKYHISLKDNFKLNLSYRITLRAKGGIWLKLTERQ